MSRTIKKLTGICTKKQLFAANFSSYSRDIEKAQTKYYSKYCTHKPFVHKTNLSNIKKITIENNPCLRKNSCQKQRNFDKYDNYHKMY